MRWVWLVALVGCSASTNVGAPTKPVMMPSPDALRIMSFNMNVVIAPDPVTIDAIAAGHAEIVLLQETNATWAAAIRDRLDYRYMVFEDPEDPTSLPGGGLGILSRDPIVKLEKLPPPPGAPFFALRAVIETKLGKIQFVDVHLCPAKTDGGSWVIGYWTMRDVREREVEYHTAELDPKLPTMIVGDYNEETTGRASGYLSDHGFTDAVSQFVGTKRTWEWASKAINLTFQLDHIMYDDHFVPLGAQVLEVGRSDHKPVIADFVRVDP
jgi:endonuclease/exonuclease/phosphatase (EEP) superfamily protein YafD